MPVKNHDAHALSARESEWQTPQSVTSFGKLCHSSIVSR